MILNPFTWFGNNKDTNGRAEGTRPRRSGARTDISYSFAANDELFAGVYHGTYPGMEKASPLARVPINTRVSMMGVPTPKSDDEKTQDALDRITERMRREIKILKFGFLACGTVWGYPLWDSRRGGLVWRVMRDGVVSDVIVNLETEMMTEVNTDEELSISTGVNQRSTVRRLVKYTLDKVSVSYTGSMTIGAKVMKNTAGILPIMFAHEVDSATGRGHSILEPVLADLKDYHNIDANVSRTVSRFRPKQVQKVGIGKMAEWRKNNCLEDDADLAEYDPLDADLILNQGDEDTDYLHLPGEATNAAEKALVRIFYKIFQGTNTPQMFFGEIATGNHASSNNDMQIMITSVQDCREEVTEAFREMYAASLRLMSIAEMTEYRQDFEMRWNRLESLSEKDKAEILKNFCAALSSGISSGALGINQLYQLWKEMYPALDHGTIEEFKRDLVRTANHQQFAKMDYATGENRIDMVGGEGNEEKIIDEVVKVEE
jgi:hypothetical protein